MTEYELACELAELYEWTDPVERPWHFDVTHNLYESLIGVAEYPFTDFASDMCEWLESQGMRDRLMELGIV